MKAVLIAAAALVAACAHRSDGESAFAAAPAPDSFLVDFETSRGPMTVAVYRAWAPIGVDRFHFLLRQNYYDGARFFRVVPHYVAQFGLPADPSLTYRLALTPIPDDSVRQTNARGTLSFANAGPNTRKDQLFINLRDNPKLDTLRGAGFPPLGRIVQGIEVIDSLNGEYNGPNGPDQDSIGVSGNAYLNRVFPRLDYIRSARIVREWR